MTLSELLIDSYANKMISFVVVLFVQGFRQLDFPEVVIQYVHLYN